MYNPYVSKYLLSTGLWYHTTVRHNANEKFVNYMHRYTAI